MTSVKDENGVVRTGIVPKSAGTYYVKAVIEETEHYASGTATGSFEIRRRQAKIIPDNLSKQIGRSDPEFTYKVTGLVGDDKLSGIKLTREVGESAGTYQISVTVDNYANPNYDIDTTATGVLTIYYPVTGIKVSPESITLTKEDETAQLTAEVTPSYADNKKVTWKSSDEKVATVDENGKVTAVGNGTATITVTTEDRKVTASVTITVKVPQKPVINKTTGFGRLKTRSTKQTKTSVTLQWNRIKDADGYLIYGNRCNANGKIYKYKKLATITSGKKQTWTQKELKKGTFYKYIVKAYKLVDGKKVVTDVSASVHAVTQGGTYGIVKSVSVTKIGNKKNILEITLKKGKKSQIIAKEVKKDNKIRHHRNLCYESSNTKVATVTSKGLIQAKGKGTCKIWVYAQNGVYKELTITVK